MITFTISAKPFSRATRWIAALAITLSQASFLISNAHADRCSHDDFYHVAFLGAGPLAGEQGNWRHFVVLSYTESDSDLGVMAYSIPEGSDESEESNRLIDYTDDLYLRKGRAYDMSNGAHVSVRDASKRFQELLVRAAPALKRAGLVEEAAWTSQKIQDFASLSFTNETCN